MFTGLIQHVGVVRAVAPSNDGAKLSIDLGPLALGAKIGDSIAVDGCCLTISGLSGTVATFDAVPETLQRTTLGALQSGARVNLEPALLVTSRIGGHFVQGHVDAAGRVARLEAEGPNWWFGVRLPEELAPYVAMKGSIALDGISLTVAGWHDSIVETAIIPFTYSHTNLSSLKVGDAVNVECDILAKYVERLMETRQETPISRLTVTRLIDEGF